MSDGARAEGKATGPQDFPIREQRFPGCAQHGIVKMWPEAGSDISDGSGGLAEV